MDCYYTIAVEFLSDCAKISISWVDSVGGPKVNEPCPITLSAIMPDNRLLTVVMCLEIIKLKRKTLRRHLKIYLVVKTSTLHSNMEVIHHVII